MRVVIISDIHGNLEALTSAIDKIKRLSVDKVICLGDVIGYGANPVECMEIAIKRFDVCIAGNHEWASIGKTSLDFFNPVSRAAIEWTSRKLAPHHIKYIENLPLSFSNEYFCAFHSSPDNPDRWHYIMNWSEAKKGFANFENQICFIGHSHIPAIWCEESKPLEAVFSDSEANASFVLDKHHRYIVNVGSVGQPRDGDPRGCLVIFDTDKMTLNFYRFLYDIVSAQKKIFAAGLPSSLAERLTVGI